MLNNKTQHTSMQVPTRPDYEVMLDQLSQATETLLTCWQERTGLEFSDDPYVEDVSSTLESIKSERREYDTAMRIWLGFKP